MVSSRAKIKGEAANNISSSRVDNWLHLKNSLVHYYANKRDELRYIINRIKAV